MRLTTGDEIPNASAIPEAVSLPRWICSKTLSRVFIEVTDAFVGKGLVPGDNGRQADVVGLAVDVVEQRRQAPQVDARVGETNDGPAVLVFVLEAGEILQDQHFGSVIENHQTEGRLFGAQIVLHEAKPE